MLIRRWNADGHVEPEELVNDCFLRLGRNTSAFKPLLQDDPQRAINYARITMQNLLRNRIRVARRHKAIDIEDVDIGVGPSDTLRGLGTALGELNDRYPHLSRIVTYRYFVGFSVKEVASILGTSPKSVSRNWTKARIWLARALGVPDEAIEERLSRSASPIRLITFTRKLYDWLLENPSRLQSLSDDDFEGLVADRLAAMGLGVKRVGNCHQKDGGVDLLAWPERSGSFPFLLAAQVKHHRTNRKTGSADVRDFHGVLTSQGSHFHFGVIVTNTSFSADAEWFARNNSKLLRLRGLSDLCRWMRDDFINEFEWREIPNSIELAPGVTIEIPKKRLWTPLDN